MKVVRHEFFNVSRSDEFRIIPMGDIHIGSPGCNEALLQSVVERIESDPFTYWISMGDVAEFINMRDPRFSVYNLAKWMDIGDMADLAKAQKERYLDFVRPISRKLLGSVEGNHEQVIQKYYERDIHREIVTELKEHGGFAPDFKLDLGMAGWIQLSFYRSDKRQAARTINISVHHGFVGGKLAGAKALNMQRWLWTHDANIALMGHSHNTAVQWEAVEKIDKGGNVKAERRVGCFTGTFVAPSEGYVSYAERKGHFPLPINGVEIVIRPGTKTPEYNLIRVIS